MKKTLLFISFALAATALHAQGYKLEIRPKVGASVTTVYMENRNTHFSTSYTVAALEAVYFIRPRVGIGVNYLFGVGDVTDLGGITGGKGIYQHYGINAMISTDRTRRFGIYGVGGLHLAQQNFEFPYFDAGRKGMAYSLGFGTVIKISRSISLNLFEVKGLLYSGSFSYGSGKSSYGLFAETGLIFKMMREK